jgi:hypothetical protein
LKNNRNDILFLGGATLFFLFFLINASFSKEYYEVRCNSVDAWKISARKQVEEYLMLKVQDDYNPYIRCSKL